MSKTIDDLFSNIEEVISIGACSPPTLLLKCFEIAALCPIEGSVFKLKNDSYYDDPFVYDLTLLIALELLVRAGLIEGPGYKSYPSILGPIIAKNEFRSFTLELLQMIKEYWPKFTVLIMYLISK